LARLDEATRPEQLDLPGFRLHPLRGDKATPPTSICWITIRKALR
jgi:hypothetical protein